ncbi:MAG: hypothetical protein D3924_08485 [Candidatus Electrothrix sp. AR4]|nr:hypothetical protein [Candidatus Electrothrix sp. AR4]
MKSQKTNTTCLPIKIKRQLNGAFLSDGDAIVVIKDLKIKGIGAIKLKSEFVKKA